MSVTEHEAPVMRLPVALLRPSPFNPRGARDEESLANLAESIRQSGLLQPVVVRELQAEGAWEIVAGERRWRAAQMAGLEEILAVVKSDLSDEEALTLALVENLQREDLGPLEEAEGYRRLADLGWTQTVIAERCGKSQAAVSHLLDLLELPGAVRALIGEGRIAWSFSIALKRFAAFPLAQTRIARLAAERNTPRKDLERGLPFAAELAAGGLARPLAEARFDTRACDPCPFAARIHGHCLNPEHFAELQAAAVAEEQARIEERRQRGLSGVDPRAPLPERPAALLPVPDAAGIDRLREERRAAVDRDLEALAERLRADGFQARDLATVAAHVLRQLPPEALSVAELHRVDAGELAGDVRAIAARLEGLGVFTIGLLTLSALLEAEGRAFIFAGGRRPLADWYLRGEE